MDTKRKKSLIAFILCAALTIVFAAAAGVLLSTAPKNEVIASADGSTVTRVARSYADDTWYYGDSAGNLVKMSADGEEICRTVITEGRSVRSVASDPALDVLIVLDEDYNLFTVSDDGEELTATFVRTFSGGYQSLAADDEYVYFAVPASRYTQFVKYDKNDLAGEPVARGQMYTCFRQGSNYQFQPVVSGTIVGMYADEDYLYVVTGEGQYHRMAKDFSLNSFPFLSDEELADLGATEDSGGIVTIPSDSYDSALYRTARKQLAASSAAFDAENGRFYIAGVDGEFDALDLSFEEIEGFNVVLPNTPATGAMAFHRESGTVYIAYDNISGVTAIDVSGEGSRVLYQANVAFYITNMAVPAGGERLLVICSGNNRDNPDYKELLSADIGTLADKGLINGLGIASAVLAAVCAIGAVFTAMLVFRAGFSSRCRIVAKGVVKNWIVYAIIFVSMAMLILFCYYPGISSMILSFFDYTRTNPTMRFNNFENYIEIFTDPANLIAFRNMLIFLLADIVIALVPPAIFALCLIFMRNKHYGTFARVVLFLPSVLPGIATLLIWTRGIYGVDGVLNMVLRLFSGEGFEPVLFLQDHGIVSLIMMGFPFVGSYLIFYGALMNIPPSYYEAAELDGCKLSKRIFSIDLPMISPQIKYVFILAFIQSVQNFSRVLMTTDGQFGTQIPIVLMYKRLQEGDYGLSSAYATLMFLVLIVVTIFNMRIKTQEMEAGS